MRTSYLVCYDICDDKRLRKVFQTMRGYGDHLQYSVFECQLTADGPGAVPGGAGGDHPPHRGPGAVREPGPGGRARRPRDHGSRQTVHGGGCAVHHRVRRFYGRTCRSQCPKTDAAELPDYLPARMVNEFAYCPRLFFYEWVEGLFAESVDTVEGAIQHRRVDAKATALPAAGRAAGIDPLAVRDAFERAAAGDREDGPGGGGGRHRHAGGLQARASARGAETGWSCGRRTGRNWRSRESCCARTGTAATKGSSITARRGSGCAWRSTRR